MRAFLKFFRMYLLSDLRNRRSIFWIVVFPILLFSVLVLTFSRLGIKGSVDFRVLLINEAVSPESGPGFSGEFVSAMRALSFPNKDGIFTLERMDGKDMADALRKVRYSEADVLVVIPKDFNAVFARSLLINRFGLGLSQAIVKVYYVSNRASSRLAQSTLDGIIGRINSSIAGMVGYSLKTVKVDSKTIGAIMKSPSYTNFVAPGMVVIATFMTGMFLVAPKISFMRQNDVLKRYAATPVDMRSFLFGFSASRLFIMLIQYAGLTLFALLVLGADISVFSWQAFLYYLFSCAVYTAIGFALGFAVSGPMAGGVLTSGMTLPLEFLAGIYFPLFNLPWYVNIFVYTNPLWYSTNAMRQYMGVSVSPVPMWINLLVPGLWMIASVAFALSKNLKDRG